MGVRATTETPMSLSVLATWPFSRLGLELVDDRRDLHLLAVADDDQVDLVAGLDVGDLEPQVVAVLDRLAVDLGDDVVLLELGLLGRANRARRR